MVHAGYLFTHHKANFPGVKQATYRYCHGNGTYPPGNGAFVTRSRPAILGVSFRPRAKLTTPESLTFGASQGIGKGWTLLAGAEWTNWSRFHDLVVRFDNGRPPSITQERWHDTWFLSAGAEYRATEALTLRAGAAWDNTPVREETRTPRVPDSDRYWLSIGASWQAMRDLTLSAAYTHIFADKGRIRLRDTGPAGSDFLRGSLDATYSASVDILSVQVSFAF